MKTKKFAVHLAVPLAALAALPASAQNADAPATGESASGLAEVIVVARRREERLQDVPIAVTAVSGEALTQNNVDDVLDLAKTTPGMNVTPSPRGGSSPFVVLRGQRVIDTSVALDPPIVFYVNEVPHMRTHGLNQALYDIQDLQVLRGPQGTQFGRSTTGGAILVNTRPAQVGTFEGYATAMFGDDDLKRVEGAVNIPLGENLAVRIAGIGSERDGYIFNPSDPGRKLSNENYNGQRVSIRWQSDRLRNDLYGSRFESTTHGTGAPIYALDPAAPFLAPALLAPLNAEIARNSANYYRAALDPGLRISEPTDTIDATNITSFEISDKLTLKNIAGYREVDANSSFDLDGSNIFTQRFIGITSIKQYSEELQLQGSTNSLNWTVGAFYFKEDGSDIATSYQATTPTVGRESGVVAKNVSYSAFFDGTYITPIENLSVSAGARITRDEREGAGIQTAGPNNCTFTFSNGTFLTPPCFYATETDFTKPSWSLGLNYKLNPDTLVYIAHRHGYRSGGVQNRAANQAAAQPFDAETVNDVEVGFKYDTRYDSGLGVVLNVAAYYAEYEGLQRQISYQAASGTFVSGVVSAADASIQGIELESSLAYGNFQLSGNIAYTDTKYDKYSQRLTASVTEDLSYLDFGFVPEVTYNLRAAYVHPLGSGDQKLSASLNFLHVDSVFTSESRQTIAHLPNYHTLDARIGWEHVLDSKVDAAISVTNLTDEEYSTFSNTYSASLGYAVRYPAPPRRVQGSITYRF